MPFTYVGDVDQLETGEKSRSKKYTYVGGVEDQSKNSFSEFFEQSKQLPMHAVGDIGSAAKSLHEVSERVGKMKEEDMPYLPGGEFAGGYAYVPKTNLPTSEELGKKMKYEEPTTVGGRYGKAIFSNIGSAIPAALATAIGHPEIALSIIGSSAVGGLVGQTAREVGAPESVAMSADILAMILSTPGVAGAIAKYGKEQVSNVLSKLGRSIPEFEKTAQLAEEAKLGQAVPFGQKPKEPGPIKVSPVAEESKLPTEKTSAIARKELAPGGPTSALMETRRSISPEGRIGESISRYKNSSKRSAGQNAQNILRQRSNAVHDVVDDLYKKSESLNANIMGDRPNLINSTEDRIAKLERQGARKYDAQAMDMLEDLRDFLKRGSVSNQDLIDRARNIRKYVQYKYPHDPKNIFLPIIDDVEREISASASGNPAAYQSYINAKAANTKWAETYNNETIRKFLNRENKNYGSLYNDLLSEDTYHQLAPVLEEAGASGQNISASLKREMVERDLKPHLYKDGRMNSNAVNSPEFREALQSIDYLNQEEKNNILNEVRRWRGSERKEAKLLKIPKPKTKTGNVTKTIKKGVAHEILAPIPGPHFVKQAAVDYLID